MNLKNVEKLPPRFHITASLAAAAHSTRVFARVIGLPSEEDWPKDSPISYSISWGPKGSCIKLLHHLGPDESDLLSVS